MRSVSSYLRSVAFAGASLLALAFPAGALAASAASGENTPLNLSSTAAHHASSGGPSIVRTIVALAIVIALIYAVARVLKAVKGGRNGGSAQAKGDGLTHLATLPLSAGRSVALVRSGSDVVLVGISESGVTPIKVYTEAEATLNGLIVPAGTVSNDAPISPMTQPQGLLDALRRMTVRV